MLELHALGGLTLTGAESTQPKRLALLCYLALGGSGAFHRRDTLLGLFWPELDASHARQSLRQALVALRALDEQLVATRGDDEVGIAAGRLTSDVQQFEAALERDELVTALDRYTGPFLDGFFLTDCPEFERWVARERSRLEGLAAAAAWKLADREPSPTVAVEWARRAAALQPDDEAALRRLIGVLDRAGDRAGALREYETFARSLRDEYQADPAPETRALIAAVRNRAGAEQPIPDTTPPPAISPPPPQRRNRRTWIVAAAIVLLGAGLWLGVRRAVAHQPAIHAIAVLPLTNLMGPDEEYFDEGMHDAVIAELSQIGALRTVISRTSVMQYRDTRKSIPEIARELGVDAVVEGSIFKAGDSVRIQIQVIGTRPSEHHIWGGTIDGELRNALALQKAVASLIAQHIRVTVTPEEQTRLASFRPVNPEAYQLYLRGRSQLYPGEEARLLKALEDLRHAIAIDSTYAPAYAGVARAYTLLGAWGSTIPPEAVRSSARAAALQAIARDSTLGEAYIALGQIKWMFDWDWAGADSAYRRGMQLTSPSATELYTYADYLNSMSRFDEAIALGKRAVELDPLSLTGHSILNIIYMDQSRYPEAVVEGNKILEIAPKLGIAEYTVAESYVFLGKLDEAFKHTQQAERDWRDAGDRSWLAYLVWGYARTGHRADALRVLKNMDPTPMVWKAVAYAGLGDREKSLYYLEQAYERHDVPMVYMRVRHVLDADRSDPRFWAIVRRMRFADSLSH